MRVTLISMLVVALLAAGVCLFSLMQIEQVTVEMEEMRVSVLEEIEAGNPGGAREQLRQMKEMWTRNEEMLAVLVPHEALHEITALIIEGNANLEADDLDDFNRSMALLGEALHHLHEEEKLRFPNVL